MAYTLSICVNSEGPHLSTQSLNQLESAVHTQYIGRVMLKRAYADGEDPDQHVHPRSMIRDFTVS